MSSSKFICEPGTLIQRCSIGLFSLLACAQGHAQFLAAGEQWEVAGHFHAAFGDANGDGWMDLLANGQVHINRKGHGWDRQFTAAGSPGGVWGDVDNDGDADLLAFNAQHVLRNESPSEGDVVPFTMVPFNLQAVHRSEAGAWGDFNGDGNLDAYLGGYENWDQQVAYPDWLLIGDGESLQPTRHVPEASWSTRGVTTADFDRDGDLDVYTSRYRLQPNALWRNDGTGQFADAGVELGVAGNLNPQLIGYVGLQYPTAGHTVGSAWGDLDNDGWLDLFVANFSHAPANQDRPQFLRNTGPRGGFRFEDRSADAGLAWQESYGSAALGDYDNDGDLDLFLTTYYANANGVPNSSVLYRNDGNWRFTDVTAEMGLAGIRPTIQAAWGDVDNDGDLDLIAGGRLFMNENANGAAVQVRLIGDGRVVPRDPIGAQVTLRTADRQPVLRQVVTSTGAGNQNDPRLHFGLGQYRGRLRAEILWPDGRLQRVRLKRGKVNVVHYPKRRRWRR